jgi:hypothetical protein
VYRAWDVNKLLYAVVSALADPLEEGDTLLFRIQRAHRLNAAEHLEDIVRLAAALNLGEFHFEDIAAAADLTYDQKLEHVVRRATAVFAEKGYHRTSVRDIARATGMSLAGLYYHLT